MLTLCVHCKMGNMDTDDLSQEAYDGILLEAERFSHDLTIHYGVLSSDCEDEDSYLSRAERLTKDIMACSSVDLDDLFFGSPPSKKELKPTLTRIWQNIQKLKQRK